MKILQKIAASQIRWICQKNAIFEFSYLGEYLSSVADILHKASKYEY